MNPTIAAAWIAGAAALAGAAVGVLGAVMGAKRAAARTIEADRRNRVWEKRAKVYTDAVAGILHKEKVRDCEMQRMTTDTAPEPPPAPVDWPLVEARLIAYASGEVLRALDKTQVPANQFDAAFRVWLTRYAQPQIAASHPPGAGAPIAQRIDDPMKAAKEALAKATTLCDEFKNIIRNELYAGPDGMSAPQAEDLTKIAQSDTPRQSVRRRCPLHESGRTPRVIRA